MKYKIASCVMLFLTIWTAFEVVCSDEHCTKLFGVILVWMMLVVSGFFAFVAEKGEEE